MKWITYYNEVEFFHDYYTFSMRESKNGQLSKNGSFVDVFHFYSIMHILWNNGKQDNGYGRLFYMLLYIKLSAHAITIIFIKNVAILIKFKII